MVLEEVDLVVPRLKLLIGVEGVELLKLLPLLPRLPRPAVDKEDPPLDPCLHNRCPRSVTLQSLLVCAPLSVLRVSESLRTPLLVVDPVLRVWERWPESVPPLRSTSPSLLSVSLSPDRTRTPFDRRLCRKLLSRP